MGVLTTGGRDSSGRSGNGFNPLHRGMGVLTCMRVVAATTERKSVETAKPDGSVEKTTIFDFVAFRDYE